MHCDARSEITIASMKTRDDETPHFLAIQLDCPPLISIPRLIFYSHDLAVGVSTIRRLNSLAARCGRHDKLLDDRDGQRPLVQHCVVEFQHVKTLTRCGLIFRAKSEPL